jgi:glutamate synthase (NADPH) large chain
MVAEDARRIMAELGFRRMDDMIGRVDCLETDAAIRHWKADGLDLTPHCYPRQKSRTTRFRSDCMIPQDHGLEHALDNTHLLPLAAPALERGEAVNATLPISNTNRTVGTILSHELVKRWGERAAGRYDPLQVPRDGGQSFGAFLAGGITLELEGDATITSARGCPAAG